MKFDDYFLGMGKHIRDTFEEKKIGIIGEISPQVITNWNFAVPATALELDLEGLFGLVKR